MIDPTVAAASIQASANIASTVSNAASNRKSYKYTKMLQQQQNAWNLEQWNRQNEYNSPKSVAERYREAGINPALIASSGELNTPASSVQSASPSQFGVNSPYPSDSGSQFMSALLASSQINKIDSETKNLNSQTDKNLLDLLFSKDTYKYRVRGEQGFQLAREKSVDTLNNNLTLQDWEIKKRQQDYLTASIEQDILRSNVPWLKGRAKHELENTIADTYMKIASGNLSMKQCEKVMTDMLVNYAQISLMHHQSNYYDSAANANNASANLSYEKAESERTYRKNGGYNPQQLKNIETKAQKELRKEFAKTDFEFRKKEWLQNPHAWIRDVNDLAHSVSEFLPWKISSSGSQSQGNWSSSCTTYTTDF